MKNNDKLDIVLITSWWGNRFPTWINKFFSNIARNKCIHLYFFTDVNMEEHKIDRKWINYEKITIIPYSTELRALRVAQVADLDYDDDLSDNFKHFKQGATGVRAMFASMYPSLIGNADFWAWCDFDVCLGKIDNFVDKNDPYDIYIENRQHKKDKYNINGAFCIVRNSVKMNNLWLEEPYFSSIGDDLRGKPKSISSYWSPIVYRHKSIRIWDKVTHYPHRDKLEGLDENGRLICNGEEHLLFHFFVKNDDGSKTWPKKI